MTVPMGTSSISAISLYEKPSTSGCLHIGIDELFECLILGTARRPARFGRTETLVEVEVLNLVEVDLVRAPRLLAIPVDIGVGEDPVEPRLQVGARLKGVVGAVGLEEGFLHDILGVRRVARHTEGGRIELRREPHGVFLEIGLISQYGSPEDVHDDTRGRKK